MPSPGRVGRPQVRVGPSPAGVAPRAERAESAVPGGAVHGIPGPAGSGPDFASKIWGIAPAPGTSRSGSVVGNEPSSNTTLTASPRNPSPSATKPKRKPPAKLPTGPPAHVVGNALRTAFGQPPLPDPSPVPHFSAAAAARRAEGQRSPSPSRRGRKPSSETGRSPVGSDSSSATNAAVSAPVTSGSSIAQGPKPQCQTTIPIFSHEGIRLRDSRPTKLARSSSLYVWK
jgi:hypothetical protein